MPTFSRLARAAGACCLLMSAGCQIIPVYSPPAGEKTVTAQFVGLGDRLHMCTSAKDRYRLKLNEENGVRTAQIPVGQRVTVTSFMSFEGYPVLITCQPAISLVATEGKGVVINSGVASHACFIEAVRLDSTRASGMALDPTVGPPSC